ncbi:MAG: hypothetical protein LBD72_01070 [Puniceicoccales bacterium]|jgi:hypothetical protein|nr:hypothetical protein [Puniceicoccales bacterium]
MFPVAARRPNPTVDQSQSQSSTEGSTPTRAQVTTTPINPPAAEGIKEELRRTAQLISAAIDRHRSACRGTGYYNESLINLLATPYDVLNFHTNSTPSTLAAHSDKIAKSIREGTNMARMLDYQTKCYLDERAEICSLRLKIDELICGNAGNFMEEADSQLLRKDVNTMDPNALFAHSVALTALRDKLLKIIDTLEDYGAVRRAARHATMAPGNALYWTQDAMLKQKIESFIAGIGLPEEIITHNTLQNIACWKKQCLDLIEKGRDFIYSLKSNGINIEDVSMLIKSEWITPEIQQRAQEKHHEIFTELGSTLRNVFYEIPKQLQDDINEVMARSTNQDLRSMSYSECCAAIYAFAQLLGRIYTEKQIFDAETKNNLAARKNLCEVTATAENSRTLTPKLKKQSRVQSESFPGVNADALRCNTAEFTKLSEAIKLKMNYILCARSTNLHKRKCLESATSPNKVEIPDGPRALLDLLLKFNPDQSCNVKAINYNASAIAQYVKKIQADIDASETARTHVEALAAEDIRTHVEALPAEDIRTHVEALAKNNAVHTDFAQLLETIHEWPSKCYINISILITALFNKPTENNDIETIIRNTETIKGAEEVLKQAIRADEDEKRKAEQERCATKEKERKAKLENALAENKKKRAEGHAALDYCRQNDIVQRTTELRTLFQMESGAGQESECIFLEKFNECHNALIQLLGCNVEGWGYKDINANTSRISSTIKELNNAGRIVCDKYHSSMHCAMQKGGELRSKLSELLANFHGLNNLSGTITQKLCAAKKLLNSIPKSLPDSWAVVEAITDIINLLSSCLRGYTAGAIARNEEARKTLRELTADRKVVTLCYDARIAELVSVAQQKLEQPCGNGIKAAIDNTREITDATNQIHEAMRVAEKKAALRKKLCIPLEYLLRLKNEREDIHYDLRRAIELFSNDSSDTHDTILDYKKEIVGLNREIERIENIPSEDS